MPCMMVDGNTANRLDGTPHENKKPASSRLFWWHKPLLGGTRLVEMRAGMIGHVNHGIAQLGIGCL